MRLSEYVDEYLSLRQSEGFSPCTIHSYRMQYTLLIRDIGDISASDVTLQTLRTHVAHNAHLKR